MARSAAERRAARRRRERDRVRSRGGAQPPPGVHGQLAARYELFSAGAHTTEEGARDRIAAELAVLDPDVDDDGFVADLFLGALQRLYEHGWQPADVAHVVRRQGTQRMGRLGLAAIAAEARLAGAATRAPQEWRDQLAAVGALPGREPAFLNAWRRAEGLSAVHAWRDAMVLLGRLLHLPALQQLADPPSRWGERPRVPAHAPSAVDARILGRIRGLLAKAESTEFPEEAESLSAKAQELMTRHALDAAVLEEREGTSSAPGVDVRRVHLSNPYPDAKARLLTSVAEANDVRVVWIDELAIATAVGLPVDLDSVELLFTSLLVQATRAVASTGHAGSAHARSASFRRAFLLSYAVRIGERLADARQHTTEDAVRSHGAELVPLLRARREAVDDAFAELFPETYRSVSRVVDARGWHAGRLAAEGADLGSGRDQVSR